MQKKPLNKCNVLVTPTSFARYDKSFKTKLEKSVGNVEYNTAGRPLKAGELISIIGRFDGMIAGLDEITKEVINNANNLKIIARYGAGVDRVDLDAARQAGIIVTNTPGANSVSVAELTIALTLAALRSVVTGNNQTKKGQWPRLSGASLSKKTFGIIGLGSIGKEVAARISCFNLKILAHDLSTDYDFASRYGIDYVDLDSLLSKSDIISLHIPVSSKTKHLINSDSLFKMKKGSVLINTSRGELVDEDALYESLRSGHLKAAALDAFTEEPPRDNKLLTLEQVIATPHMGAATDDASNEMTRMAVEDCLSVLGGEMPRHPVF